MTLLQTVTDLLCTHPYVRVIALDFSKAFDSLRHTSVLENLSVMTPPDNVYNWVAKFLTDRSHSTRFQGEESTQRQITASVVQGSAVGPAAFIIAASDLRPLTPGNAINKFADDTYLIIPSNQIHTTPAELSHIEQWLSLIHI